jgi:asparagine synthase (glutamine-hydrolysing)
MGIKPLYYHPTPDGVLFGSEPKAILAHPTVNPVVDLDGLRELLALVKTPGHAVYRGMAELKPGYYLRVRREGMSTHRYWSLEAREHTDNLDTTIDTVRELLTDIVSRQLIADVALCTLLSGGLDSSAITALAANTLSASGAGPVQSFAVDFIGQTEKFQPDPLRATPDGPFAHLLAKHVGADHADIVLDAATLIDPQHRSAVLRARDLPSFLGDMDTSLYLLFREIRKHSTVALSGESADEVFGGYSWFHDPIAVASDNFPWLAAAERMTGPSGTPRESLINQDLMAQLDLPAYLRDTYNQALAEVPHITGADPMERRMREICYLHLTRFVTVLLDRKDRLSMASGLEVRVPFCDHRLVQYVFNTPWAMKNFDGREKSLLRAATQDLLPKEITERVKSPYPVTQDPSYPKALHRELCTLAGKTTNPSIDLLNQEALTAAMTSQADPQQLRTSMEMVLGLDSWLREYPVSLRL